MNAYRLSKYNQFMDMKDCVVGLNLYNQRVFSLDKEKYDTLISHESDLENLQKNNPVLFSTMYKLGIIEDQDMNIPEILILKNRQYVFSNHSFRLVISPTLNCNFSCWYCYETHSKKYMTKETMESVIKLIESLVTQKKISRLHIDWFGGEPLLCYESIIKPISVEAKRICEKNNVTLCMDMTTNGFYIREDMIPFFEEHNFRSIQITLDGNRVKHNLVRFQGKNRIGSFDTIINSICLIAQKKRVALRFNYTRDNIDDFSEVIEYFPENIRSNIRLTLVQIWQDRAKNSDADRIMLNNKEMTIYKKFRDAGFYVNFIRFSCGAECICYADMNNEAVVNYDGRVFKCTTEDFDNVDEDGILTPDGKIRWNEGKIAKKLSKPTFDNELCMQCEYLPLCSGGCSKNPVIKVMKNNKCHHKPRIAQSITEVMEHFNKKNYRMASLNTLRNELFTLKTS